MMENILSVFRRPLPDAKASSTFKRKLPKDGNHSYGRPCPAEGRFFVFRASFAWVTDLIRIGYRQPIVPSEHLCDLPENMMAETVSPTRKYIANFNIKEFRSIVGNLGKSR